MTGAGIVHQNNEMLKLFKNQVVDNFVRRVSYIKLLREILRLTDENEYLKSEGLEKFYKVETVQFQSKINGKDKVKNIA